MRAKLRRKAVITGGYDPEYTRALTPHNRFDVAPETIAEPAPAVEPAGDPDVPATTNGSPPRTAPETGPSSAPGDRPSADPGRRRKRRPGGEATRPLADEPLAPSKRKRTVGVPKARTEVLVGPTDEQARRVAQGDLPADMRTIAALALKRLRSTFKVDPSRAPEPASMDGDHGRQRFPAAVRIPERDMEAYRAVHDPFALETTARLVGGQVRTAFQTEIDAVIAILAARGR